jgi:2-polyprenyl-6-methoxyphenol hydroxylase-like FAD-dependent oxidoreductase
MDIPAMKNSSTVLIVGAGPTGLMMACELARHGISFRIIDKKPECTLSSNATLIQARTVELFDHIGIADRFLDMGHRCEAINLYAEGNHLVKMPLNYIDSPYPFILMLPQSKTEKLLDERLNEFNLRVERSLELIDIKCDNNSVVSTIRYPDGRTEMVTSDWVIACDGSSSIIREKCGLHFAGEDLTEQFMVADASINFSSLSKDEMHLFFDEGTLFAAYPLGSDKYRIAANLHLDYPRKIFTEREVIEIVQERAHGKYYVTNISWISPFWIHGKVVDHMRHGPIFFAGDAAHIHSPAAGQGMNTGLQDAYNLAWKLALVIKNQAKQTLLDTYHIERYPIIQEVVNQNDYYTKVALFNNKFMKKLLKFSDKLTNDIAPLSKKIGMNISQLDIRYENSPVIDYEKPVSSKSPKQGERAPDVKISQSKRLYDYFRNTLHNVLILTAPSASKDDLANIDKLKQFLDENYSNLIQTNIINYSHENDMIYQYYPVKNSAIYIIRPDTYIAYSSNEIDLAHIEKFLKSDLR